MAKLKGPLFSLGASQQLGKTLVYFGWKGLNVVRSYVVPSNPQTANQLTQRGYVTAAVAEIHATQAQAANALCADDQVAYSALASAKGKIMTWFNQAVKLWVDVKVAGNIPIIYGYGVCTHTPATGMRFSIGINEEVGSSLVAGKFYLGTSKTNLIQSKVATITAGISAHLVDATKFTGLTVGQKYYWQFRPDSGDPCEGADSGIYYAVAT